MHHQRGLHRHRGAITRVDVLDLACDQPIGHIAEPRPAVFFRHGRADQPERAHLAHDLAVEALLAIGLQHARKQLLLRVAARRVAHHAFFFRKLALEVERILPVEVGILQRDGGLADVLLGDRHGAAPDMISAVIIAWWVGRQASYPRNHTASAPSSGQPIARPALAAASAPGSFASKFAAMMRFPV